MTRTPFLAVVAVLTLAVPLTASADDAPGSFTIPGTETSLRFNGFAETTMIYQLSGGSEGPLSKACDYYLCAPSIALTSLPGSKTNVQMALTSAYSRFGVATTTPSDIGPVGARFEMDAAKGYQLIGDSATHSSNIRIRHAYGTVGSYLLIGQTWSTFGDLNTFPDQLDQNPVANLAALRAPMIRATVPAGRAKVTLALEDPYATSIANAYWNVPDIIARVDLPFGPANLSVRGVAKQYKNPEASAFGFGGAVGLAVHVAGDTLALDFSGGPGIGAYAYGTILGPVVEDAVVSGSDMKLWTVFGGSLGFTHMWSPKVSTNLIGSGLWTVDSSEIKDAVGAAYGTANKAVYTGGLNTRVSLAKNFWAGAEFYANYRKDMAGNHGTEVRGELVGHFDLF